MQEEQELVVGQSRMDHIQQEDVDMLEAATKKGSVPIFQFFAEKDADFSSWVE
jgi:hypothetical protein